MSRKIIMTSEDIRRSLTRIAHEIIEQNKTAEHLILVGIHTRGVPLANRLARNTRDLDNSKIPVGALDISFYRDDLSTSNPQPIVHNTDIPFDINGKTIVLIDDVLYTGRSIRAAMDALIELGRPRAIQLAILVDRGHREMPIRADYVGKNVPSARHEKIQVRLEETDGVDEVAIISTADNKPFRSEPEQAGRFKRSFDGHGK